MFIKADWLSFSVVLNDRSPLDERYTENAVIDALDTLNPLLTTLLGMDGTWKRANGRAPYGVAWQHPSGGITVFYNVTLPHALVEISGKGCDLLEQRASLENVMQIVAHRVTRVDIACDMLTDVRPIPFAESRPANKFKSHSYMTSESGETYYVGSRSSNRYARVYRYNAPHERHKLLRCEYVIKSDDAKFTVQAILTKGVRSVAKALGEKFGWTHEAWAIEDAETAELEVYRAERHEGKTLYWLSDTIAPMLVRLHEQGVTDVRRWFNDEVLMRLGNDANLTQPPTNQ